MGRPAAKTPRKTQDPRAFGVAPGLLYPVRLFSAALAFAQQSPSPSAVLARSLAPSLSLVACHFERDAWSAGEMSDLDLIGRTLSKRFIVRRLIGKGGMGAVYEVEHAFTKRVGALKLLHADFAASPDVVARFVNEASAAGHIGSAHIVESVDAGELDSGEPYLFMELLDGSPVSELIQARGQLRFDEAIEIAIQAADGLAAAHAAGIVHRDVKPENLFLCRGPSPFVKLLDFGISKFTAQRGDHRITREGSTLGTPYYMSPEQAVGERDLDHRTDVYSLGVVLYECVTGKTPFDAEALPGLVVKIYEGQYTPVSELRPDAPPDFDAVLGRAMARRQEDRFESMNAFRQALAAFRSAPLSLSSTLAAPGRPSDAPAADLFGETLAPAPISEAGMAPRIDTSPHIAIGQSVRVPSKASGRTRFTVLALAGVAGVAALWLVANGKSGAPAAEAPAVVPPATSVVTSSSAAPVAAPSVAPALAANRGDGATPSASSTPRPAAERPKPRPRASAEPAAPSRAHKDGLSETNPF